MFHRFLFLLIGLLATDTIDAQCDPCNECGTFVPDHLLFSGGITCQVFQDNDYGQFGDLTKVSPDDPICLGAQATYCSTGCCSVPPVPPEANDDGDGGGGDYSLICEESSTGFYSCLSENLACIQPCSEATPFTGNCDPISDEACRAQICEQYGCCPACENKYKEYINCVASQDGFMYACPIAVSPQAPSIPSVMSPSTTITPMLSMTDDNGGGGSPACVGKMEAAFSCFAFSTGCEQTCSNREVPAGDCNPITNEACRLQICEEYSCCAPCENKFKDYINCEASQFGFDMACSISSPTAPSAVSPSTSIPPFMSVTDDYGGIGSSACLEKIAEALSCYEVNPGCEQLCMNVAEPTQDCDTATDEACRSQYCGLYACCPPCENKFKGYINCEASQIGIVNACPIFSPTLAPVINPSRAPTIAPTNLRFVPTGNDSSNSVGFRDATTLLMGCLCFLSFVLM